MDQQTNIDEIEIGILGTEQEMKWGLNKAIENLNKWHAYFSQFSHTVRRILIVYLKFDKRSQPSSHNHVGIVRVVRMMCMFTLACVLLIKRNFLSKQLGESNKLLAKFLAVRS